MLLRISQATEDLLRAGCCSEHFLCQPVRPRSSPGQWLSPALFIWGNRGSERLSCSTSGAGVEFDFRASLFPFQTAWWLCVPHGCACVHMLAHAWAVFGRRAFAGRTPVPISLALPSPGTICPLTLALHFSLAISYRPAVLGKLFPLEDGCEQCFLVKRMRFPQA